MTKFNRQEIADYCSQGHTVVEACKKFGCSYSTVYHACSILGDGVQNAKFKRVSEYVRQNDATVRGASEVLSFSTDVVRRACRRYGVVPRPSGSNTTQMSTLKIIARMLHEEVADVQIANDLGVSKQRISEVRRSAKAAGILK